MALAVSARSWATSFGVQIAGFAFSPPSLTINVGDTVVWTQIDSVGHNTVSDNGLWTSPVLSPGQTFSFTFNTPGTFGYLCTIHPFMTGSVTVVGQAPNSPPTVALTSPTSGAVFDAPGSVTLSATAADSDGSVSQVEFFNGHTSVGVVSSPPYSLTLNNLVGGNYSITAVATDNQGAKTTSAAVSFQVNAPPIVALTSPTTGSIFKAPAAVTVSALASDSDGSVSQVEFFNGGVSLGVVKTPPYSLSLGPLTTGAYSITAVATDNLGGTATSVAVAIAVDIAPSVAIIAPANGAILSTPASTALVASASDSDGTVVKVEFFNGATSLGVVTNSPFQAPLANVPPGTYTLTARATDNQGLTTTSAPISISIDSPPSVTITGPANGVSLPAPASVTVVAAAADTDGSVAKVEFFNGANPIGLVTGSPYQVALNNLPAGIYSLTAKATDDQGATAVSTVVSIVVTNVPEVAAVRLSIVAPEDGSLSLAWSGGTAPYRVQKKSSLADANWLDVMTTTNQNARVPNDSVAAFFRIAGAP